MAILLLIRAREAFDKCDIVLRMCMINSCFVPFQKQDFFRMCSCLRGCTHGRQVNVTRLFMELWGGVFPQRWAGSHVYKPLFHVRYPNVDGT